MDTGLRDFDSDVALLTEALDEVIAADGGAELLALRGRAIDLTRAPGPARRPPATSSLS